MSGDIHAPSTAPATAAPFSRWSPDNRWSALVLIEAGLIDPHLSTTNRGQLNAEQDTQWPAVISW